MPSAKLIYADFMKTDDEGRIILACYGTKQDLEKYGIELEEGLELTFYSDDVDDSGKRDDLIARGVVTYNNSIKQWVAVIDWNLITHCSDYSTIA